MIRFNILIIYCLVPLFVTTIVLMVDHVVVTQTDQNFVDIIPAMQSLELFSLNYLFVLWRHLFGDNLPLFTNIPVAAFCVLATQNSSVWHSGTILNQNGSFVYYCALVTVANANLVAPRRHCWWFWFELVLVAQVV